MTKFRNEYDIEFYKNAAIAAMQGIQESGTKLSLGADIFVKETAKIAFKMADAMLDELHEKLKDSELESKSDYMDPEEW